MRPTARRSARRFAAPPCPRVKPGEVKPGNDSGWIGTDNRWSNTHIAAFITNPLDVGSKAAAEPAPVAAKEDRSAILASGTGWGCAQGTWPSGGQRGGRA